MGYIIYDEQERTYILTSIQKELRCGRCKELIIFEPFEFKKEKGMYFRTDNNKPYHRECVLDIEEEFEAVPIHSIKHEKEIN